MGRTYHSEWHGFARHYENGKLFAQCITCGKKLSKHSAEGCRAHRRSCTKNNANANSENENSNNSDSVDINSSGTSSSSVHLSRQSVPKHRVTVSQKLKDRAILRHILLNNLEWTEVNNKHFQKLIAAFDATYTIPTADDLKDTILQSAINDLCLMEDCNSVLLAVTTTICDNDVYCISFIQSQSRYYFLLFNKFNFNDDANRNLENFIIESCMHFKNTYDTSYTPCVILQSTIETEYTISLENGDKLYLYRSVLSFLKRLEINVELQTESLRNMIQELSRKVNEKYMLCDAVEDVFKYVALGVFDHAGIIICDGFICPLGLAANYFDPNYKGHFYLKYDVYKKKLHSFLYKFLSAEALSGYGRYFSDDNFFSPLEEYKNDRVKYWSVVAVEDTSFKPLVDVANKLLKYPSAVPELTINQLRLIENYNNDDCVFKLKLLFSMFVNDD